MLRTIQSASLGAVVAAVVTSPALAQAMPASIDTPTTITFYNYNLASAGLGADATRKLIDEFEAANPNITVDAVGINSAEINARVQADLAAGSAPDVVQLVFDGLSFAVDSFGLKALEDIVPADELAAHFEGMSPNGLELGRIDGKTWALAYTFSTPVVFYNADIFRAAGLDPDDPPSTWAEVKAAAQQIEDNTDAIGFTGLIAGAATGSGDTFFQALVLSSGGRVLSEDRTTLSFGEPEAVEAVAMLRDLADAGLFQNLDLNSILESMSSGNSGMMLSTSALQSALLAGAEGKFELRAAGLPGFGGTPSVPVNTGSGLTILSADPIKQRAAWELMKFLTSERGYTVITSEIGYLPLRTAIVDDPAYLADWVAAHPMVLPNLAQLERLQPWVSFPGTSYRQIQKTMMDAVEQSIWGGADIAPTMADAQAQAQALMP